MDFAWAARPKNIGRMAAIALLALSPLHGLAQSPAFAVPLEELKHRAATDQPIPPAKPVAANAAPERCEPENPALSWANLPRTLRDLPLRAMIGQLLMVSYSGAGPDAAGVDIAVKALRRSEIGGVLTFRHNIESADATRAINARFRNAHPVLPAMIAIDQEGGAVMRIKETEGGPRTPSARDIAKGTLEEASRAYGAMAQNLADLGFTINFGPVVDLAVNPSNPVIARFGRSYGDAVDTVVAFAKVFIEAHKNAGVATSLKHFPGHGSSTADSHEGAIDLTSTWKSKELRPFAELISGDLVDTVMIGHLELDGVSGPGDLPASLSPTAITGLLRNTLCFHGLVVTDDLAMSAVEDRWGSVEAARLMVAAGGDIALVSLPAKKGMSLVADITDRLAQAATASPEFYALLRQAYARVVRHKLRLPHSKPTDPQAGPTRPENTPAPVAAN